MPDQVETELQILTSVMNHILSTLRYKYYKKRDNQSENW